MQPSSDTAGAPGVNLVRTGPRGGAPVFFLHAVSLDLTWWDGQFAALGGRHDLVAFDLPGHGGSAPLAEPPTFERLADVAARVVENLAAGPAHVVGISVGGMIAQALALARPELVRSLTLVATLCTFPEPVRTALRERARTARTNGMEALVRPSQERWFPPAFRAARPDVLDRAAKQVRQHAPAGYAALWETIAALEFQAQLPAITCPTLVVAGGEDVNAPVAAGQRIAELIPGATLRVLPGVGHFPPVEAPAAFNALLGDFIDGQ